MLTDHALEQEYTLTYKVHSIDDLDQYLLAVKIVPVLVLLIYQSANEALCRK